MKKPNVLMLAWKTSSLLKSDLEYCAKTEPLFNGAKIYMILPQLSPNTRLERAKVIGLNNVDLHKIQSVVTQSGQWPFAQEPSKPSPVPLYRIMVPHISKETAYLRHKLPGETVAVGTFTNFNDIQKETEQPNFFIPQQFEALSLNTQVILFARYASRFASQMNFDFIYAYDWMTLLAGTEIKVLSNKKLVINVGSLDSDPCLPDSKGWIYEVKKQAFAKADVLIAANKYIATKLYDEYGISSCKINIRERESEEILQYSLNSSYN